MSNNCSEVEREFANTHSRYTLAASIGVRLNHNEDQVGAMG